MRHARHVRRSTRTPSRAEMLSRNIKKRGAGPEPAPVPEPEQVIPDGAPYDPITVTVRDLPEALAEVHDPDAIRAMRSVDPRSSAHRHYDARLEELADA